MHGNSKLRTCCEHKLFWMSKQEQKTICVHNMFWAGSFHYWTGKSMNNLLSYCGLVDSRMRASDIDLPVCTENGWKSSRFCRQPTYIHIWKKNLHTYDCHVKEAQDDFQEYANRIFQLYWIFNNFKGSHCYIHIMKYFLSNIMLL